MPRTRKIITASLAIASLAGTAVAHDTLAQSAKRPMSVDDMMTLKNVGGVAISPNGSQVVYVVSAWEHPNANPAKGDTGCARISGSSRRTDRDRHDRSPSASAVKRNRSGRRTAR